MTTSKTELYSLGDGILSLTGEHRGFGANHFTLGDNAVEKNISNVGENFALDLVTDHEEVRKNLTFTGSFDASASVASGSASLNITRHMDFSKNGIYFFLRITRTDHSDKLKKTILRRDFGINPDMETFVASCGDRYVSQIDYGKDVLAIIHFEDASKKQAKEIKHSLQIKVKQAQGLELGANENLAYATETLNKHANCDIKVTCSGVELPSVSIFNSVDSLFSFMKDFFNDNLNRYTQVSHSSLPYATAMKTADSKDLEKSMSRANNRLNQVRNKIHWAKSLKDGLVLMQLKHVDMGVKNYDPKKISQNIQDVESVIRKLRHLETRIVAKAVTLDGEGRGKIKTQIKEQRQKLEQLQMEYNQLDTHKDKVGEVTASSKSRQGHTEKASSGFRLYGLSSGRPPQLFFSIEGVNGQGIKYDLWRKREGEHVYHTLARGLKGGIEQPYTIEDIKPTDKFCVANVRNAQGFFKLVVRQATDGAASAATAEHDGADNARAAMPSA